VISIEEYESLVENALNRNLLENPSQHESVTHTGNDVLMVVAGPGSGKTTVLVLRALRHVLVDNILPENLLITTFTRKAAKELRTRWLDWGTKLLEQLHTQPEYREQLARIDLNRCRIDTLDSIAQLALTENRLPGEIAPIVAEGAASKIIFKRTSFSRIYNTYKNELDLLFSRYTFDQTPPQNRGEALSVAKSLCDRLIQDRVDLSSYARSSPTHQYVTDILTEYLHHLNDTNVFDFSALELRFLERLRQGSLQEWLGSIGALLIDEYQDTNPLQEEIYFEVIAAAAPVVTVVGDDDQSMYRFRGGSVELFTQFSARCDRYTSRQTRRVDMITNYRSSDEIVSFYNSLIVGDANFSPARINPSKPEVISNRGHLGMPVLGMFRESPTELAESLSNWLTGFVENRRVEFVHENRNYELTLNRNGNLGDCVLLSHSIVEAKYNRYNSVAEERFTGHLRHSLEQSGHQIFNPRGRPLRTILSVKRLLGLLLLCLDPTGQREAAAYPTNESKFFLAEWRVSANAFIQENPAPNSQGGLQAFVNSWAAASLGQRPDFPQDWPVLELIFKLITWIPDFQIDPEHQVWLEAITRTVSSAGMASPYGMQVFQSHEHRDRSRESFIRDALLSIAENEIDVDEDIMANVPRDRLQLMTIHQSKGLEFPLVIVDVGSHFSRNHHAQAHLRFPRNPSNVALMEDDVEPHLQAPLRGHRSTIARTFDDLVRLYYVAYSRPQSVLMLVGCEALLNYGRGKNLSGAIPNVALNWTRDGVWPWRQASTGRAPIRVTPPICLI
jgi:DNA helicase-2/ATP-dependent DNA helicase PcrA